MKPDNRHARACQVAVFSDAVRPLRPCTALVANAGLGDHVVLPFPGDGGLDVASQLSIS